MDRKEQVKEILTRKCQVPCPELGVSCSDCLSKQILALATPPVDEELEAKLKASRKSFKNTMDKIITEHEAKLQLSREATLREVGEWIKTLPIQSSSMESTAYHITPDALFKLLSGKMPNEVEK